MLASSRVVLHEDPLSKADPGSSRPVFVVSHQRSGTHLTIDLMRRQFPACRSRRWPGEYLHYHYLDADLMRAGHRWHLSVARAARLLDRAARPLVKTHSLPGFDWLPDEARRFLLERYVVAERIYVARDGRDVLCSLHLWRQEWDASARCSLSEFLRQENRGVNWVRRWAEHVRCWLAEPEVHVLRYEEVVADPAAAVARIAAWAGLTPVGAEPLLPPRLRGPWHRRWMRFMTVDAPSTAVLGRYRGRSPAAWREVFTRADRAFFQEQAGDALLALGYEDSEAWIA